LGYPIPVRAVRGLVESLQGSRDAYFGWFDGGENGASMEINSLANLPPVSIEAVIIDGIHPNLFGYMLALAEEIRNSGFPRFKLSRTGLDPRHPTLLFETLEDAMRKCGVSFTASKPFK
jgi:hypothetical protein